MIDNNMTLPRRQRKPRISRPGTVLASAMVAGLGLMLGFLLAGPIEAATTERIVIDRNSGLAISGFDPVAYFTDAKAIQGKGEFEQVVAGAAWRFASAGNSAAFRADSNVYMPRFGGYDPVDVARGVAVAGNPRLWTISGERLYLFYSAEARDEFVGDSDRIAATADREWPAVSRLLVP
jgi:hypothetical protein